jgi:hypothetical protein
MIIESNKKFAPHPETTNPIRAVIVDVTEPKEKQTAWGPKKKFAIVFETEMKMDDGKNWTFWSHGYTPVLGEKSNLQKDALKIFGVTKLPARFETEDLIGRSVKLIIEHRTENGEIYSNMTWLGADTSPEAMRPSGHYERQKDRAASDTGSNYTKAATVVEAPVEDWRRTKVHVGSFTGQHLENLDVEAITKLIVHWIPLTQAPGYKTTADDRRLLAALTEANKVINPATPKDAF